MIQGQSLQQAQKLIQHLSPQQILQSALLQLNSLMLEARMLQELELNPALELAESEESAEEEAHEESAEDDIDWDEILNEPEEYDFSRFVDTSRDDVDLPTPASQSFIESLMEQLKIDGLTEAEFGIAEEILGNLDLDGYLRLEPLLIAERLDVSETDVETLRQRTMRLNPPGVGALDLQECLLIQLEISGVDGLAHMIIESHFEDFANRRFNRILQDCECTEEDLQQAMAAIERLNPKPGAGESTVVGEYIVPDIIIDEVDGQWIISLNDTGLPDLRVSPTYVQMMTSGKVKDTEARQFVRKKVESARWFIQAVQQRRQTIVRVMETILQRQEDFFIYGKSHLKPMILRDIAEEIEMDISTISRVTNGKYAQTPNGIYELKYFFSEGMTTDGGDEVSTRIIKSELGKIIDSEDKREPFNDERLAELLKDKGYPVARRTVAKYRDQLKIPVARLRREL